MSDEPQVDPPELSPEEEQAREQLEAQIRELKMEDMLLQSAVSVLNLTHRRIAKEDERDLAEAKIGIEATLGFVEFLPEEAQPQVRQMISELQMLFAQTAGPGADGDDAGGSGPGPGPQGPGPQGPGPQGPGAPPGPKLWTPGQG